MTYILSDQVADLLLCSTEAHGWTAEDDVAQGKVLRALATFQVQMYTAADVGGDLFQHLQHTRHPAVKVSR